MYQLVFQKDIKKLLKKVPLRDQENILETIQALATDPRPRGVEKLKSRSGYRVRVGNYRILYTVDDGKLIIYLVDIDDRKDVYS
jgi:mRNA interferase RelE/StbE